MVLLYTTLFSSTPSQAEYRINEVQRMIPHAHRHH